MKKDTPTPPPTAQAGRSYRHRFETPFWRKVLLTGVKHIPQAVQRATMPLWAGIFYTLVPTARRTVEGNLAQVLGHAPSVVQHARSYRLFVNYSQSVSNLYALHLGQKLPVEPVFDEAGRATLRATLARGKGAILVTGHLGFWALGPYVLERSGIGQPTMAMAEEPNASTHAFEQQFRKKWRVVYTTGSPFASLELASLLRRGEMVAMQLDRHTGGATTTLPFFGKRAPFPLGPATLARATRAPLVPVFMVREGANRFVVRVEEPIEVPHTRNREADLHQGTEKLVRIYEHYVGRYPYQWFNFHDFWAPPEVTHHGPHRDVALGA